MNSIDRSDDELTLISKIFLYLLPTLGVIGVIVPFIIGKTNFSLIGIYLAIPMILAPIVYTNKTKESFIIWNQKWFLICLIFYFICVSISLCLLYIHNVRPIIYYIVIAVMYCLILLEIVQFNISRKEIVIILFQLMILIENIIWGVNLKYNFYISRTDPIAHVWFIQNLIDNSYITDAFDIYKSFPLWHILCTFIYQIAGLQLPTHKTMFFTNGIVYSFVPVVTYLTSLKIFKDCKIALLSALFISLYPVIISYGMASIARSVVSFLEIILILLLLETKSLEKKLLVFVLSFSLIAYHTASLPFIILLFIIIYVIENAINDSEETPFLSSNFIILLIVMTLFYWVYYAPKLFETLLKFTLIPVPSGVSTKYVIYDPLNELLNYLQYSPLLLFVIIGFLESLQSKKISTFGKVFCITGFCAVSVSFPGPALLLSKLANDLEFERFGEYAFLFIGLVGTIGFYEIYKRSRKYSKAILIILFVSMAFLSVSNEFTAGDNPLVKRPFYTPYLTNNEETAFRHIAYITQGYVMSDYVTIRYLEFSKYNNKAHYQEIDSKNMSFLRNQAKDVILIRKSELSKRPLKFYSSSNDKFRSNPSIETHMDYYYNDFILWNDLTKYSEIYDSGSVEGFN